MIMWHASLRQEPDKSVYGIRVWWTISYLHLKKLVRAIRCTINYRYTHVMIRCSFSQDDPERLETRDWCYSCCTRYDLKPKLRRLYEIWLYWPSCLPLAYPSRIRTPTGHLPSSWQRIIAFMHHLIKRILIAYAYVSNDLKVCFMIGGSLEFRGWARDTYVHVIYLSIARVPKVEHTIFGHRWSSKGWAHDCWCTDGASEVELVLLYVRTSIP